jgi:HYPK-like protein
VLPVRAPAKNIKVDPADVALLVCCHLWVLAPTHFANLEQVDELDLPKTKATELLKTHEGDAIKAIRAFIQVKV